jgi:hypothetical protein
MPTVIFFIENKNERETPTVYIVDIRKEVAPRAKAQGTTGNIELVNLAKSLAGSYFIFYLLDKQGKYLMWIFFLNGGCSDSIIISLVYTKEFLPSIECLCTDGIMLLVCDMKDCILFFTGKLLQSTKSKIVVSSCRLSRNSTS